MREPFHQMASEFRFELRLRPFPILYHACPICSKLKYSWKAGVGSINDVGLPSPVGQSTWSILPVCSWTDFFNLFNLFNAHRILLVSMNDHYYHPELSVHTLRSSGWVKSSILRGEPGLGIVGWSSAVGSTSLTCLKPILTYDTFDAHVIRTYQDAPWYCITSAMSGQADIEKWTKISCLYRYFACRLHPLYSELKVI
jgi:hypothetical protein